MPRVVNHHERRIELGLAVWDLIRTEGIGGVTIRRLGERSGWSSGAIRHYLPNRQAILNFAVQQVGDALEARFRALPARGSARQRLLATLQILLPLDQQLQAIGEVWLAFTGAAVSDPALARTQGLVYRDLRDMLQALLAEIAHYEQLPDFNPVQATTELHALLDGLTLHLLLGELTPEQAVYALKNSLNRLLGEENTAGLEPLP